MGKGLLGVIAAIVIMAVMFFSSYNGLVSMNENVTGKWSQVENQLQRRNDLIPNLVNTVKGYAAHETEVFKAVSDARAKLGGAKTVAETTAANNEMNSALSRLLVVAENYPDLKANTNFQQLQDELAGTENRIAVAGLQRCRTSLQRKNKISAYLFIRRCLRLYCQGLLQGRCSCPKGTAG